MDLKKRERRKVPLPRDAPKYQAAKIPIHAPPDVDVMEKRLNAALANALDGDIMNHLMGKDVAISTDLMPQELAPNAPKAGRRKSNSVEPPDRNSGGISSRSCGSDGASESELMSSLIRRLTEAEREIKVLKSDKLHKAAVIKELERKNAALEAQTSKSSPLLLKRMETENRKLTSKIKEMEKFLADYGLTWVGDPSPTSDAIPGAQAQKLASAEAISAMTPEEEKEANAGLWLPEKSVAGSKSLSPKGQAAKGDEMEFDMSVMKARIAELNHVAGEGKCDVAKNKKGEFKLAQREYMELAFWKNGFQVNGAPLRSYAVKMNRSFVQDLLDGYFPYELKKSHPDGIPFTVLDRSFEHYHRPFSQADGVDAEAFLQKLPKNVIRNGKVIPVRAGVEDMVKGKEPPGGNSAEPQVLHVDATEVQPEVSSDKVATLRITSAESQKTFMMKFSYSTTVAEVLQRLAQEEGTDGNLGQFQLQTTFPKKTLEDESVTLVAAGLVPKCALVLVPVK